MKYFKKLLITSLISTSFILPTYAQTLQGFLDHQTTLVPLRTITKELGATISTQPNSQKITLIYQNQLVEIIPNSSSATINGLPQILDTPAKVINGTTYVPLRFLGQAFGGIVDYKNGEVTLVLDELTKKWTLDLVSMPTNTPSTSPFKTQTKKINGKTVKFITINMNDPRIRIQLTTANNQVNQATTFQNMIKTSNAYASVNGTYFAAYNGDMPLPDGTLVKNSNPLHITDIGCTIGFTSDNQVLIDFVTTRIQGYINGNPSWSAYRINRPTPDTSTTVLYTSEYVGNIPLTSGWTAIICQEGQVTKKVSTPTAVPQNGFILTIPTQRSDRFNIGDQISYEVTFTPQNTSAEAWQSVTHALSAGPSLLINNEPTPAPKEEGFSESKILTQSAQRSFIGVNSSNQVTIGTTSATINEMKSIVKQLGLKSAMCLDGGASSGLYYNGQMLTTPGRPINNAIHFIYNK